MCKGNEYVKLQNSIKMQHYEWKLCHPATYNITTATKNILYMTFAHICLFFKKRCSYFNVATYILI